VEARWPALVDGLQGGSLADKLFLSQVRPTALEGGVVTLGGDVDLLELQRREASCRRVVEAALAQDFGLPLRVRFGASPLPAEAPAAQPAPPAPARAAVPSWPDPTPEPGLPSLDEYAAELFGGRLIVEDVDAEGAVLGIDA
jgi:hypothetical protein